MSGFAMGHPHRMKMEPTRAKNPAITLKRIAGYLKPFGSRLLLAGLLAVAQTLLAVSAPILIGRAVDILWAAINGSLILSSAGYSLNRTMLLLLTVYTGSLAASAGSFYIMIIVGQKVLFTLRSQVFHKIESLSLRFFDKQETGDMMSRMTNDTEVINRVLSRGISRFASSIFTLAGILIAMLTLNLSLALVSFSILPLMVISTLFFSKRVRKAYRRTRKTIGKVSVELEENISGVRVAQAFSRQRENIAGFREVNKANRQANIDAETITAAFSPTLDVLSVIGTALVLGYGGYLALHGFITVGIIVAFLQYVRRFFQPVRAISHIWSNMQSAIAGAERIFELLEDPLFLADADNAEDLSRLEGKIQFKDVFFSYDREVPVLKGVSFVAEPGQTIALVGPTGVGKTTIINLIARFYDLEKGSVLIDGRDVRKVTRRSLRSQMGIVLQDTFLFSDTVMENIRYGHLDADDEAVKNAASLANAHDFIMKLPEAYHTKIMEGGSNLSRGQCQLLSISRAVLADPRILILDEATSSVDTHTEKLIQQALAKLLKGRTSIVAAHRLSTIRRADVILVIKEGMIVERGKHEELLPKQGTYYSIYKSQFQAAK